jgi:hypothetical protein
MIRRKAHIFNLDNLIVDYNPMVWIIDKNKPNEPILKINKSDYDVLKMDVYKGQDLSISFNGKKVYINQNILDLINKKIKNKDNIEELSFSFREFTNPEDCGIKPEYDLSYINHLKNSNDDIYFIVTKGSDKKFSYLYNPLIDELNKNGIIVKQIYYLNQSYFAQNKDQNIKKICYIIIQNLLGKEIENGKVGEELDGRKYDMVEYYDSNYVSINKIKLQISNFINQLNIDPSIRNKKLLLKKATSNMLNIYKDVPVDLSKHIKTFEYFNLIK